MKKFIKELVTNRFGIVLAALNLCYLAAQKFVPYAFSHGIGDECTFFRHNVFFWIKLHYNEAMFDINLPAALAALIHGKFTQIIFPDFCFFTHARFQIVAFAFFVTFQWLFIGWTAKTVARLIQPKRD
ncbi:MAG: hypothetical protein JWN60_2973 [Acidobacteria bacterium]|nr:hypothetical protein [Acidobacteriota bacterium]